MATSDDEVGLARCLVKGRKARIPDLSVVRYMLDGTMAVSGPSFAAPVTPRTRAWVWPAAAVLFALTTIAAGWAWYGARAVEPAVTRFVVAPPAGTVFTGGARPGFTVPTISPDGQWVAFTARDPGQPNSQRLFVRAIDAVEAQPLAGTEGASYPFWSPDSRSIGYAVTGSLMKVSAAGGPVQKLCALNRITPRGGTWGREGVIIFNNGPAAPLYRVAAAGGPAVAMGKLADGESDRHFPAFLPDGRHFLFHSSGSPEVAGVSVGSLDSDETTRILPADTGAIYDPSSGYLLFVRQGTLLAQVFDPDSFDLTGDPVPVAEKIEASAVPGVVAFSLSSTGILVYGVSQSADASLLQPTWVDRQGKVTRSVGPKANYRGIDLSPDGLYVAAHRHDGEGGDIWVTELARNATSRFTQDPTLENQSPAYAVARDGQHFLVTSRRETGGDGEPASAPIVVVLNWFRGLAKPWRRCRFPCDASSRGGSTPLTCASHVRMLDACLS